VGLGRNEEGEVDSAGSPKRTNTNFSQIGGKPKGVTIKRKTIETSGEHPEESALGELRSDIREVADKFFGTKG